MPRGTGLTKTKYQVSDALASIVGSAPISRPDITKILWKYIKAEKLQGTKDKRVINPDVLLAKVTGSKPFNMMQLAKKISSHIHK
jgi:DNA topoisomerase-3